MSYVIFTPLLKIFTTAYFSTSAALRTGGYYIRPVQPRSWSATPMLIGMAMPPIADPHPDTRSLSGVPRSRGAVRSDLQEEVSDPTTIYCDHLRSIQLAKNPVFHAWTKHIEVHYHFVRERVLSGEVVLQYIPTDRQTADIFTKPLGLDKLRQFSGALGLRHLDVPNLRGSSRAGKERKRL